MSYIHLALFIAIAICLLWIGWKGTVKEGFDEDASSIVFTNDHCPLLSSQMRGYQEAQDAAAAENKFSSIAMYETIISGLKTQMATAGCTGNEAAAKVPMALPSTMSATDIEAVKDSASVIDLSTVPNIASVTATESSQKNV